MPWCVLCLVHHGTLMVMSLRLAFTRHAHAGLAAIRQVLGTHGTGQQAS